MAHEEFLFDPATQGTPVDQGQMVGYTYKESVDSPRMQEKPPLEWPQSETIAEYEPSHAATEPHRSHTDVMDGAQTQKQQRHESFLKRHPRIAKGVGVTLVGSFIAFGVSETFKRSMGNMSDGVGEITRPVSDLFGNIGEAFNATRPTREVNVAVEAFRAEAQETGKLVGYEQDYDLEVGLENVVKLGWPFNMAIKDQRYGASLDGRGFGAFYVDLSDERFDIEQHTRPNTFETAQGELREEDVEYLVVKLPPATTSPEYTNIIDMGEIDQFQSSIYDVMEVGENVVGWVPWVGDRVRQTNDNVDRVIADLHVAARLQLEQLTDGDEFSKEEAMESVQAKLTEILNKANGEELDHDQIVFKIITETKESDSATEAEQELIPKETESDSEQ